MSERANRPPFGGAAVTAVAGGSRIDDRRDLPVPARRRVVDRRVIGHCDVSDDARTFANSTWAEELCRLGTSCPDHFLRTRISPMFVPWDPAAEDVARLRDADRRAA